jgi:hypothetical protein
MKANTSESWIKGVGFPLETTTQDCVVVRNPGSSLSLAELGSLRRMANRWVNTVPSNHKDRFMVMGLVGRDRDGGPVLSELGWQRLEYEVRRSWGRSSESAANAAMSS